jgi:hypothetical protein
MKTSPAIVAIGLIAVSCTSGISHVQTLPLPTPNPTTCLFPLPVAEVQMKALQAFSLDHQFNHPVFGRLSLPFEDTFDVECATNAVFGEAVFRDPANAHDIYLHTFGEPFTKSSVYRGRDGPLAFSASFHLHLAASGQNTTVTVIASNTEVVNGTRFGVGPCGPGWGDNVQHVRPTTVEEYSILRYLGNYLGVTNMPNVILPTQTVEKPSG